METIDFIIEHVLKTSNSRVRFLLLNRTETCLGFGGNSKTLKQCADEIGVTPERVRQICLKINRCMQRSFDRFIATKDDKIRVKLVEKKPDCTGISKVYLIENMYCTVRVANALKNEGINTVEQLMDMDARELLRVPNFGKGSLIDLMNSLEEIGYGRDNYGDSPFWKGFNS